VFFPSALPFFRDAGFYDFPHLVRARRGDGPQALAFNIVWALVEMGAIQRFLHFQQYHVVTLLGIAGCVKIIFGGRRSRSTSSKIGGFGTTGPSRRLLRHECVFQLFLLRSRVSPAGLVYKAI
jgi:hypothetical protein